LKVIILAGGYATRMFPLTLDMSKPLLPVGDKLMIDWIIDKIDEIPDVEEIVVVTNEKFYDDYVKWRDESNQRVTLLNDKTTCNEDRLGMFGDIVFGLRNIAADRVLVINGDNLFKYDLNEIVRLSKEKDSPVNGGIILDDINEVRKMGVLVAGEDKKLSLFEEKPQNPKSMLISTGCYMLNPKAVELIRGFEGDREKSHVISFLFENLDLYIHPYEEEWIDIGSKEQYDKVNADYSKK
jgi:glucose-1-phosphate thymidylyltransferase